MWVKAAGETPSLTGEFVGQDPQGPRMYVKPPTWESAPEGPNLLVGSKEVTESQVSVIVPSLTPPQQTYHNTATWVTPPWRIPKALHLTV